MEIKTRRTLLFSSFPIFLLITFTFMQSFQPVNAGFSLTEFAFSSPQAAFTYMPSNPWVNGIVTFNASDSKPNGGTIINYTWNFGDSTPIVTENDSVTTHVYNRSETYVVTLNITDSEGLWCTTSKPVTVSPGLELTVMTDKPKYYFDLDQVQIQGNITFDGNPVPDGLVALEVRNPTNRLVALRTLKTGTAPISGTSINITELYLCDQFGNPVNYTIKGGVSTYIYVSVKNIGNETLSPVIITLYLYQGLNPLCYASVGVGVLYPDTNSTSIPPLSIPSWVSLGNVTAYVSVLSNYPYLGGYPYCQEKFLTFPVADPLDPPSWIPFSGESPPPDTNGTYNSVLKMPVGAKLEGFSQGYYTIYVSAYHEPQQVTNSITIEVKLAGDFNGDAKVGYQDFGLLAAAYGSKPGDPNWNPNCDVNGDNRIGYIDFGLLAKYYGSQA